MGKDPAFMLYSSDFLTGVIDLDMEERGQYITMMCLQHQKGHLSEKTIRFCVGYVSDNVLEKFQKDENGLYFNERLEKEIEQRRNFVESRINNGKKGGRPKSTRLSVGKATDNLHEDEDEIEDEIENRDINVCPFSKISELYLQICVSFPQIKAIEGNRKKTVAARWGKHKSLDIFESLFKIAEASSFLKGKNERGWNADFDWMMKPSNFEKILEHRYDDKKKPLSDFEKELMQIYKNCTAEEKERMKINYSNIKFEEE